jgi:hypothetical protein
MAFGRRRESQFDSIRLTSANANSERNRVARFGSSRPENVAWKCGGEDVGSSVGAPRDTEIRFFDEQRVSIVFLRSVIKNTGIDPGRAQASLGHRFAFENIAAFGTLWMFS